MRSRGYLKLEGPPFVEPHTGAGFYPVQKGLYDSYPSYGAETIEVSLVFLTSTYTLAN